MLILQPNQSASLSPAVEARDTGWSISDQLATHSPCNPGTMTSKSANGLVVNHTYVVTYQVVGYTSGMVQVKLGDTAGTARRAVGVYTEILECTGSAIIGFYSDGELTIDDNLAFYEQTEEINNAVTVSFHDPERHEDKKWGTYYSYAPEMMIRFINQFFSVQGGGLWQHNINDIRNNFYGVQYNSQISFYENKSPTTVKVFMKMRVEANTPWFDPNNGDISIAPIIGRASGMSSRLKRNNFRNYQGNFFADFMRNYLDGRFENPELALYKGEPLRGRVMAITLTNPDTTEAILLEVDVATTPSMLTY